MFESFQKIYRKIRNTREWNRLRHESDHRATRHAVKMVLSGILKTSRRGVTVTGRAS